MTPEQEARNILWRLGIDDAPKYTAGDLAELANVIAERDALKDACEQATRLIDSYKAERDALRGALTDIHIAVSDMVKDALVPIPTNHPRLHLATNSLTTIDPMTKKNAAAQAFARFPARSAPPPAAPMAKTADARASEPQKTPVQSSPIQTAPSHSGMPPSAAGTRTSWP